MIQILLTPKEAEEYLSRLFTPEERQEIERLAEIFSDRLNELNKNG